MSQADYENSEQVAGLSMNACQFSLSAAYAPFSGLPSSGLPAHSESAISIPSASTPRLKVSFI
jgi:hypothetical protein